MGSMLCKKPSKKITILHDKYTQTENTLSKVNDKFLQTSKEKYLLNINQMCKHVQSSTTINNNVYLAKRSTSMPFHMSVIDIPHKRVCIGQPITMNIRHLRFASPMKAINFNKDRENSFRFIHKSNSKNMFNCNQHMKPIIQRIY